MIYKTFFGHTIDLDKVAAIADASIIDVSPLYLTVGFTIMLQDVNSPLVYKRPLYPSEYDQYKRGILLKSGGYVGLFDLKRPEQLANKEIVAIDNLQKDIDQFIEVWNIHKKNKASKLIPPPPAPPQARFIKEGGPVPPPNYSKD
jgi:hypothetical protein